MIEKLTDNTYSENYSKNIPNKNLNFAPIENAQENMTPLLQIIQNTDKETEEIPSNTPATDAGKMMGMAFERLMRKGEIENTEEVVEGFLSITGHFFSKEARANIREVMESALDYTSTQANPKESWEIIYHPQEIE